MENQIQLSTQVADSVSFSAAVSGLTANLFEAAARNIDDTTAEGDFTDIERRAMITAEALRLVGGMDLAAILMRGEIIRKIETEGLVSVHPNGYADITALAAEQGVSISELSDTRALCDHIFPYITDTLGRDLHQVWSEVGKSSFRELVPALRAMITGEQPAHRSVRTAVEGMLNGAAAQLRADEAIEDGMTSDEINDLVRRTAVASLLTLGAVSTTRDLRRTVRPARTVPVEALAIQTGDEEWYAVLQIRSQDQFDMVRRALGDHQNSMLIDGRNDTHLVNRLSRMFPGV